MPYSPSNLSALAYANGFTLWHYKTSDTGREVLEPGYFNPAASMLRPGDFLFANYTDHFGRLESGLLVTTAASSREVLVTELSSTSPST